ncbi:MAG: site-specific integrase [Planctomycetales bacterium]|nr:site-specific integrase [Planctomycetales bacterium]
MATVRRRENGSIEIRFIDHNGKRKSLYPGQVALRDGESMAAKVEHIVSRKVQASSPDVAVAHWIAGLSDKLHSKLVKLDLVPAREPSEPQAELAAADAVQMPTIKHWTNSYIEQHPGKERTILNLKQSAKNLCTYFKPDKALDSFTAGDAERFRKWLQGKGLAENTVRCRIRRAKQFFNAAMKDELLERNPFAAEKSVVGGNDSRLFMVPAEWIETLIRKAPCEDWRIILAFARYAGMRAHECCMQRWEDIDLANNRMVIRSNKTPPIRSCPIFPELRPHLLRAREMAPTGAEYVQTRYSPDSNLRTTLLKIITAAKLVPWPRLMQNLRATRETELLAKYPAKDVTSWLGNSPSVATKHYAMATQESFIRATQDGANLPGITCGVDSKSTPKSTPHIAGIDEKWQDTKKAIVKNPREIWHFLAMALADSQPSTPNRTRTCD